MKPLKAHPVAAVFPEMSGAQFAALVADIKQNGLREPILLHPDGSVIDGRNRYRACLEAGVEPVFRPWDGGGSIVALVLSLNLHRRHLDESQRAMVAARSQPLFEEEAQHRKGTRTDLVANLPPSDFGKSRDKAAELLDVSPRTVQTAAKVMHAGAPELIEAVDHGEVSVSAAAEIAELPDDEQRAVVAEGRKKARATASELRKTRKRRRQASGGNRRSRKHPHAGEVKDPSDEELLSGRLLEPLAHYEEKTGRRVAGIEIARTEGMISGIRIIHESDAA
ncbi:MAG TPA: ParB N-terminal domain-containing protein [Bryobacteraceae bacterium]|jgi:ParB-like chromosome segregation protein Spo0J|nr:ParB N-terminal domain-containing protein [Bryobacteraceae bacterium]